MKIRRVVHYGFPMLLVLLLCSGTGRITQAVKADFSVVDQLDNKTALPIVLFGYSDGVGSVTGTAFDATSPSREPLSNVSVCYQDQCGLTDSDGSYLIEGIPDGLHVLNAARIDFYDIKETIVIKPLETSEQDFAMLPLSEITDVFMRVLLTWNETETWPPDDIRNDMDAHLWLEAPNPPTHINFVDRGDCTTFPNACLEVDYQKGFGPETLAIRNLESTVYHYGVLNYYAGYPGVPNITESQAKVRMFQEGGTILEYDVPTVGEGDFWYVFKLVSDGSMATVVEMNCITVYTGDPPVCAQSGLYTPHTQRPLK